MPISTGWYHVVGCLIRPQRRPTKAPGCLLSGLNTRANPAQTRPSTETRCGRVSPQGPQYETPSIVAWPQTRLCSLVARPRVGVFHAEMPVTVPECSLGIRKGGGSDATWCSLVGNLTLLMLRCLEDTDETLPVRRVDRRGCDGAVILRGRLMMLQVLVLNFSDLL